MVKLWKMIFWWLETSDKMADIAENKLPIRRIMLATVLLLGLLCAAFVGFSIWSQYDINGLVFPWETRLTKDTKNYKMRPGTEFDVEFPDKSAFEANFLAEVRLGKIFYDNAMTFAANHSLVKDAVGKITEIRPAKGKNATFRPFTDGNGGGEVTLRVTGDKGVIVVRVSGSGPFCSPAWLETIALRSHADSNQTAAATLSPPIRLLDEQAESDYDKNAKKYSGFLSTQAERLEKAGRIKEAEVVWKQYVAESERCLDDKNFAAIRYQMLAEYNEKKVWSTPILLVALGDLGNFYQRQKQPEKERETLHQLMDVAEALCPERLSGKAEYLRRLGDSYERSAQLKEATKCMAEELALHEKYQNPFRAYVEKRKCKYQELMRQLNREANSQKESPETSAPVQAAPGRLDTPISTRRLP
jgi:hypothetical protein